MLIYLPIKSFRFVLWVRLLFVRERAAVLPGLRADSGKEDVFNKRLHPCLVSRRTGAGQCARDVTVGCCSGLFACCVAFLRYVHRLHRFDVGLIVCVIRLQLLRVTSSVLYFACFALRCLLRWVQLGIVNLRSSSLELRVTSIWHQRIDILLLLYANSFLLQHLTTCRISWTGGMVIISNGSVTSTSKSQPQLPVSQNAANVAMGELNRDLQKLHKKKTASVTSTPLTDDLDDTEFDLFRNRDDQNIKEQSKLSWIVESQSKKWIARLYRSAHMNTFERLFYVNGGREIYLVSDILQNTFSRKVRRCDKRSAIPEAN
ncbi:hypothetical protein C0J45_9713 [Silurus meridionalis]|uniref:Uncharacterized protein n=1 Tax=Silurus meridionalis TaxID=175797 RepID=A0A8T0B9Q6_SILME|nr:hypothetical protein HF521_001644 [Silurus meridionalis]KAI5100727.1 hypothetical protein C0J45_9713 [Silurus meridionalis]